MGATLFSNNRGCNNLHYSQKGERMCYAQVKKENIIKLDDEIIKKDKAYSISGTIQNKSVDKIFYRVRNEISGDIFEEGELFFNKIDKICNFKINLKNYLSSGNYRIQFYSIKELGAKYEVLLDKATIIFK